MTMGNSWSYVENDVYKSTNTLIHMLIDIVSKGGNFLLNVGPSPLGTLPEPAILRMQEIGNWMKVNGKAIYSTRPIYPYKQDKIRFTQAKNGAIYAFYLLEENESLPNTIKLKKNGFNLNSITILGSNKKLKFKQISDEYEIIVPQSVIVNNQFKHAVVFEIK